MVRSFTRKTDNIDINHAADLNILYDAVETMSPMTTAGDIVIGGTSGVETRLAKGADGTVLLTDPTTHLPIWTAGVTDPTISSGDLIYRNNVGALDRIALGASGQVLTTTGSPLMPRWANNPQFSPAVSIADITVGNTTTETLLGSRTAASDHSVGTTYRFNVTGVVSWIATSGTLTFRLKLDTGVMASVVLPSQGSLATSTPFQLSGTVTIRNPSLGYMGVFGRLDWQGGTTQLAERYSNDNFNTSANGVFGWSAQWATANAGNTLTVHTSVIERTWL